MCRRARMPCTSGLARCCCSRGSCGALVLLRPAVGAGNAVECSEEGPLRLDGGAPGLAPRVVDVAAFGVADPSVAPEGAAQVSSAFIALDLVTGDDHCASPSLE